MFLAAVSALLNSQVGKKKKPFETKSCKEAVLIRTVRTVTEVDVHIEDWAGAVAPRTLEKRFKAR